MTPEELKLLGLEALAKAGLVYNHTTYDWELDGKTLYTGDIIAAVRVGLLQIQLHALLQK